MSLLEPMGQPNGLYIHPFFDEQWGCWSADLLFDGASSDTAFLVYFHGGTVGWDDSASIYVRAVRSWQLERQQPQEVIWDSMKWDSGHWQ
jgi:hypothetical protein